MNKYLVVLAGGLLFATAAAMAAPQQHGRDSHHEQASHGHDNRNDRGNDHRHPGNDNRNDHRDSYYVVHDRGRHEGWYRKGGHVPVEYRGSRYVVTDWRARRLREPPRGYHWVRSDNNDYLLIAVATGVIASIFAFH